MGRGILPSTTSNVAKHMTQCVITVGEKTTWSECANQTKKDTHQKSGKSRGLGNRGQLVDQDEFGEGDGEDYIVLNVKGGNDDAKLYYMEGFIYGNSFRTMIDTGSPVTTFALDEFKKIIERKNFQCERWSKANDTWISTANHCNDWDMSPVSCR